MAEQTTQQPVLTACEYKTGKTLGKGSYATVKEAGIGLTIKIKTGEKYAVKMISKKLMKGREYMILNEIEVLKKISKGHPNILNLWDYFETPNNLYLVMDLCTGGELFDRICEVGQFYEKDAVKIIHTVLSAVKYLHDCNVVHRDLKPENLLFKDRSPDSELLIADFGLSKLIDNDGSEHLLRTTCGTPGYMAPEVVQKLGHGKPVDLWSLGVMSYFLLCGYMPFETPTEPVDINLVLKGAYSFDEMYWSDVSQNAKEFIMALLLVDPKRRLTVEQALEHPWMVASYPVVAKDLFPKVRKGFNARKTFRKAVDVVKAVNKLTSSSFNLKTKSVISEKSEDGDKMIAGSTFLTATNASSGPLSPLALSVADIKINDAKAGESTDRLQDTLLIIPGGNNSDPLHRSITK